MRILKFNEFINENELPKGYGSYMTLPDPLKAFLNKHIKSNIFSKVVGSNYFGVSLEGENLYFILNGEKILIPFIKYRDDSVFLDKDELSNFDMYKELLPKFGISPYKVRYDYNSSTPLETGDPSYEIERIKDVIDGKPSYYDINSSVGGLLVSIIGKIYNDNLKSDKSNYLNPFDTDLERNQIINNLRELGVSIVSSERQKKNGTIQFRADFLPADLTVNTSGYIRRLSATPAPITKNLELSRPIYTQEDIDVKLSYIFIYCLKILLKNNSIPTKTINSLSKSFINGEYLLYDDIIKDIAQKNPTIAHLLPDPNNVINSSLKRGAAILSRFNIF